MAQRNVGRNRRLLANREEVEQLQLDGDTATHEAIFRALVDHDHVGDFEQFVDDEAEVSIEKMKNVGFGVEVTLR